MIIIIRYLTTVGAVGGINRLFYTETRHLIAAAAENRFHFVENPEQKSVCREASLVSKSKCLMLLLLLRVEFTEQNFFTL